MTKSGHLITWGLNRLLIACLALSVFECKDASTSQLLDAKFPIGGQRSLQIISPSPVTVGQPFTITVRANNTVLPEGVQQNYQNAVALSLQVGAGTLSNITYGGWFLGRQNITLIYNNPALTVGSTEVILLKATDTLEPSLVSTCNNITASAQVVFNQFKVVAPGIAFKQQAFNLTVTATNSDNSTNIFYNGTVNLNTHLVAGTVTPSTVTGFVNGVATVSVTVSQAYTSLQIKAADSVTPAISGLSNAFQVYFDSVAFVAFPQTATSVRSEWHYPTNTTQALIYRDSGSGFQLLQTLFSPTNYYTDLGLTTGQSYTYRVVAQDNLASIQYTATMAATPSGCSTTVSGAITSATWTSAGSPYCVTGNITVSGTLTINPGVVVLVNPTFSITIASGGTLLSQGTNANPITITSSNISPVAGDWGGLIFATGAIGSVIASDNYGGGSLLQYTTVEYAGPGVTTAESLYLDNCTIQNNRSTVLNGAGISATMAAGRQVVIRNGLILNNTLATTPKLGAGIYVTQRAAIYSSLFANNTGTVGGSASGAAAYISGDNSLINSTQFLSNTLTGGGNNNWGGAIYLGGALNTVTGNLVQDSIIINSFAARAPAIFFGGSNNTVTNNVFKNNSGSGVSNSGGALYFSGSTNTVMRNTFSSNSLNTTGGLGGAVSIGSGNTFTYNVFTQGTAGSGGALATNGAVATVNHNNFNNNTATNGANVYYSGPSTLDFTNNYWGGATSGQTAMGICDASNTGGSCGTSSGTIDASGAVGTAWPLCKTAPSDPNCVGANF